MALPDQKRTHEVDCLDKAHGMGKGYIANRMPAVNSQYV